MGFDTDLFVQQPVDEDLIICGICLDVLKKPITACKNGHDFCEECIDKSKTCPKCRASFEEGHKIRIPCLRLQSIILKLEIACPKREMSHPTTKRARVETSQGESHANKEICCDWKGSLSDYIEKHQNGECAFRQVACPFPGCGMKVLLRDLHLHKTVECKHRLIACDLCHAEMQYHELRYHKLRVCPEAMTACGYCGEEMVRKNLGTKPENHSVDDLPGDQCINPKYTGHYSVCGQMLVKCDFHPFGCTELIKREDLDSHFLSCRREHAQLCTRRVEQVVQDSTWHFKCIEAELFLPVATLQQALVARQFTICQASFITVLAFNWLRPMENFMPTCLPFLQVLLRLLSRKSRSVLPKMVLCGEEWSWSAHKP